MGGWAARRVDVVEDLGTELPVGSAGLPRLQLLAEPHAGDPADQDVVAAVGVGLLRLDLDGACDQVDLRVALGCRLLGDEHRDGKEPVGRERIHDERAVARLVDAERQGRPGEDRHPG